MKRFPIYLLQLCLLSILLPYYAFAQSSDITFSGFVHDHKTDEELIGVNVLLYSDSSDFSKPPLVGTSTNSFGYYKLTGIKPSQYYLVFRMMGYTTLVKTASATTGRKNSIVNVSLTAGNINLSDVIIEGKKIDKKSVATVDISPQLIAKLPTLSGQTDVFKLLELLPGINKSSDLSSGLYVRGGSPDQTLTLVDEMIFYNPAHIGNIASAFNSDVVRDMKLIKGAFPAEYGGRLSSVLDIKLRSGTREKEKGVIGLGLINSYMMLEGPLKERSTYIISGRWMYYDAMQKKFNKNTLSPLYTFYDVNGKFNNNYSDNGAFSLSAVYNYDHAYNAPNDETTYDMEWKNLCLSLNWLQITSGSVFLNSSASIINYQFSSKIGMGNLSTGTSSYYSNPDITDYILKQSAEIHLSPAHKLKTGFELSIHNYRLKYGDYYNELIDTDPYAGIDLTLAEGALYVQHEYAITNSLSTNSGLRFYYFGDQKMFRVEPRFSFAWQCLDDIYIKGAAALAHQFLHLIVRNDVSLPTDLWYPSTQGIEPGKSIQYSLGLYSYLQDNTYELSLEGYFKSMHGLYEFKNESVLNPLDGDLEKQFTKGAGEAYGAELFFSKKKGDLTGWIGYTLSWTKRKFPALNDGQIFFPKYDRRHELSVVLTYPLLENLDFGLTFNYATGQRFSLPNGQYMMYSAGTQQPHVYINYPGLNTSKFPDYHKLDISFTYSRNFFGKEMQAYLTLYNVYNRQNAFSRYIIYKENAAGEIETKIKNLTLFPFIPIGGVRIKF